MTMHRVRNVRKEFVKKKTNVSKTLSKLLTLQRQRGLTVPSDSLSDDVTEAPPTKVTITNQTKTEKNYIESTDDPNYDELKITDEEIKEFENGPDT